MGASAGSRWSAEDRRRLVALAQGGASGPEAAAALGRSTGAVQQKAMELGIALTRVEQTPWRRDRQQQATQEQTDGEDGGPQQA